MEQPITTPPLSFSFFCPLNPPMADQGELAQVIYTRYPPYTSIYASPEAFRSLANNLLNIWDR